MYLRAVVISLQRPRHIFNVYLNSYKTKVKQFVGLRIKHHTTTATLHFIYAVAKKFKSILILNVTTTPHTTTKRIKCNVRRARNYILANAFRK